MPKAEQKDSIEKVLTNRPKRKELLLKGKEIKAGSGSQYRAFDVFSNPGDGK